MKKDDINKGAKRFFKMNNNKKVYLKKQTTDNLTTNKYTLEDALESGLPIYTRARNIPETIDKGIPNMFELIKNGHGYLDGEYVRINTPLFIYNYLSDSVTKFNPGTSIIF